MPSKLFFIGKILNNEQKIEVTGMKDGDFIVLMVTSAVAKPKPAPPAPVATAATPSASAPSDTNQSASSNNESTLVTGAAYEEAITRITEMGFPRDQAILALRVSFNNPDRAVEYLTSVNFGCLYSLIYNIF